MHAKKCVLKEKMETLHLKFAYPPLWAAFAFSASCMPGLVSDWLRERIALIGWQT